MSPAPSGGQSPSTLTLSLLVLASAGFGAWAGRRLLPPPASSDPDPDADVDPASASASSLAPVASEKVHRVVLTGGPCGGKTTALADLSAFLRHRGLDVSTVPEAFTLLMSHGLGPHMLAGENMDRVVQRAVLDLQCALEDACARVLGAHVSQRADGRAVLLCDRGLMDGAAYLPADRWRALLDARRATNPDLRECRYDAVLHLVTAAEGAERHYTTENNDVRTETPERAREMDDLTRRAWLGHPRHRVFDNSTDFEGKMRRVRRELAGVVGIPLDRQFTGLGNTAKYLLRSRKRKQSELLSAASAVRRQSNLIRTGSFVNLDHLQDDDDVSTPSFRADQTDDAVSKLMRYGIDLHEFPPDLTYKIYEVEKVYLYDQSPAADTDPAASDTEYSFVRRRSYGTNSGVSYGQTTVRISPDGEETEVKRIISAREYAAATRARDAGRHVVRQVRVNFIWEMQSCTLTLYAAPVDDVCVLYCHAREGMEGDPDQRLPNFLDIERRLEGAEDKERYGSYSISLVHK